MYRDEAYLMPNRAVPDQRHFIIAADLKDMISEQAADDRRHQGLFGPQYRYTLWRLEPSTHQFTQRVGVRRTPKQPSSSFVFRQ